MTTMATNSSCIGLQRWLLWIHCICYSMNEPPLLLLLSSSLMSVVIRTVYECHITVFNAYIHSLVALSVNRFLVFFFHSHLCAVGEFVPASYLSSTAHAWCSVSVQLCCSCPEYYALLSLSRRWCIVSSVNRSEKKKQLFVFMSYIMHC